MMKNLFLCLIMVIVSIVSIVDGIIAEEKNSSQQGAIQSDKEIKPAETKVIKIKGTEFGKFSPTDKIIISGKWGSKPGEFGKSGYPGELPIGPMSFAVDKDNHVYVLDQVNSRMQKFDSKGKYLTSIEINTKTADDIVIDKNGNIYISVFIRGGGYKIKKYTSTGILKEEYNVSLKIQPIGYSGTELLVKDENLIIRTTEGNFYPIVRLGKYVPVEKQHLQHIPGQLNRGKDIYYLSKKAINNSIALIEKIDEHGKIQSVKISIDSKRSIGGSGLLGTDMKNNIYLFTAPYLSSGPPHFKCISQDVIIALTFNGDYIGQVEMPSQYRTDSNKRFVITESGEIYQMQTSEEVKIVKWQLEK